MSSVAAPQTQTLQDRERMADPGKDDNEPIKVKAQLTGFKSLSTGGWRLTLDLFESEIKDILVVTGLVNESKVVEVEIRPIEE